MQDIEIRKKKIINQLDKLSKKNSLSKTTTIYKKGDQVYFKKFLNSKLDDTWIGPGKVVEVKKNAVIVKVGNRIEMVSKRFLRRGIMSYAEIDN